MPSKPQIIIENYDPKARIIEGKKIEADKSFKRFREKGVSIDQFKKLIRENLGDSVEIINQAQRNRDVVEMETTNNLKEVDDRYNMRDIREAMRNDSMRK